MSRDKLFDAALEMSSPPPGAVNVRTGTAVEGPGGRWVPCASEIKDQMYVACIFEVGPGRRQVCANGAPTSDLNKALALAMELAAIAAA